MAATPTERLVISYLDDRNYHREDPARVGKPMCDHTRGRGVLASRTKVERYGQTPCEKCWPES